MKKLTISEANELVTKGYLYDALKDNNKELEKKFRNIFVTKEELKATQRYLEYKIDAVATELKQFKEEMYKFKDSVLKSLDWLVGAFQKFDEEYLVSNVQYKRVSKL
jgi:predicted nuclease with TOPRIM domain